MKAGESWRLLLARGGCFYNKDKQATISHFIPRLHCIYCLSSFPSPSFIAVHASVKQILTFFDKQAFPEGICSWESERLKWLLHIELQLFVVICALTLIKCSLNPSGWQWTGTCFAKHATSLINRAWRTVRRHGAYVCAFITEETEEGTARNVTYFLLQKGSLLSCSQAGWRKHFFRC